MTATPIETYCFALAVVREADRFLLVHEREHGRTWYFPAGAVEPGETFVQAARREVREEAGVEFVPMGILHVEHRPTTHRQAGLRVMFVGHAAVGSVLKSVPDEHSLEAGFFTLAEVERLPLRGDEVVETLRAVEQGAPVHSLALLSEHLWWRA